MKARTLARMAEEERSRFAEYRDRKRGGPPREPKPHGTTAAALRHKRAGEPMCEACAAAWKKDQAEQYKKRKAKASPQSATNAKKGRR